MEKTGLNNIAIFWYSFTWENKEEEEDKEEQEENVAFIQFDQRER